MYAYTSFLLGILFWIVPTTKQKISTLITLIMVFDPFTLSFADYKMPQISHNSSLVGVFHCTNISVYSTSIVPINASAFANTPDSIVFIITYLIECHYYIFLNPPHQLQTRGKDELYLMKECNLILHFIINILQNNVFRFYIGTKYIHFSQNTHTLAYMIRIYA